jgi:hypothetical protein
MKIMVETLVNLELSEDEAVILKESLQSFLSDLRMEIADTDRMEFRDGLKHRKMVLMKVVELLG